MTYRERREAKAERLRTWAAKRVATSSATLAAIHANPVSHDIAFNTQPGHIPARAQMIRQQEGAWASAAKARDMSARADGIEAAADLAIYSDDHDAVDRLTERRAGLEAKRERIKAINTAGRKGKLDALAPPLSDDERKELTIGQRFSTGDGKTYPGYVLRNLAGNITRQRDRIKQLEYDAVHGKPWRFLYSTKYAGTCCQCGKALHAGSKAAYRDGELKCWAEYNYETMTPGIECSAPETVAS